MLCSRYRRMRRRSIKTRAHVFACTTAVSMCVMCIVTASKLGPVSREGADEATRHKVSDLTYSTSICTSLPFHFHFYTQHVTAIIIPATICIDAPESSPPQAFAIDHSPQANYHCASQRALTLLSATCGRLQTAHFLALVYTPAASWHSTRFAPALGKSVCRRCLHEYGV